MTKILNQIVHFFSFPYIPHAKNYTLEQLHISVIMRVVFKQETSVSCPRLYYHCSNRMKQPQIMLNFNKYIISNSSSISRTSGQINPRLTYMETVDRLLPLKRSIFPKILM